MSENLREYVAQAISGNKNAYGALYRLYFNSSYFMSYNLVGEENSTGIVCESFIEVFETLKNLKNPDAFGAYVKYVTARKCYGYLKNNNLVSFRTNDSNFFSYAIEDNMEFLPKEILGSEEYGSRIMTFVKSLSAEQRLVIFLYYYNRMPVAKISAFLKCPEETVKSVLFSSREAIHKYAETCGKKRINIYPSDEISVLSSLFSRNENKIRYDLDRFKIIFKMIMAKNVGLVSLGNTNDALYPKPVPLYNFKPNVSADETERKSASKSSSRSVGKKITAIVLIVAVLISMAVVGFFAWKKLSQKDNPEISDPETSTTLVFEYSNDYTKENIADKTTEVSTEEITEETTVGITAGSKDIKKILGISEKFIKHTDRYDYKASDARKVMYNMIFSPYHSMAVYSNYFDDHKKYTKTKDPLNRFMTVDFDGYYAFPAEKVDWIIINVFNLTPDHSVKTKEYYYKDGFYYVGFIPGGDNLRELSILDSKKNPDGTYDIKVRCEFYESGDEVPYAVNIYVFNAVFRETDGIRYWSIYRMNKSGSEKITTTENATTEMPSTTLKTTKTDASSDWKTAYNAYLKDVYNNEEAWGERSFGFAYITDDDIPELLISEGTANASRVKIATVINGKVVDLGEFGSVGSVDYIERESLIIDLYSRNGNFYRKLFRINKNGSVDTVISAFSNGASGNEPLFKINDVEVSEEVYEKEMDEKWPKQDGKSFGNEDGYAFTYENFDRYC